MSSIVATGGVWAKLVHEIQRGCSARWESPGGADPAVGRWAIMQASSETGDRIPRSTAAYR